MPEYVFEPTRVYKHITENGYDKDYRILLVTLSQGADLLTNSFEPLTELFDKLKAEGIYSNFETLVYSTIPAIKRVRKVSAPRTVAYFVGLRKLDLSYTFINNGMMYESGAAIQYQYNAKDKKIPFGQEYLDGKVVLILNGKCEVSFQNKLGSYISNKINSMYTKHFIKEHDITDVIISTESKYDAALALLKSDPTLTVLVNDDLVVPAVDLNLDLTTNDIFQVYAALKFITAFNKFYGIINHKNLKTVTEFLTKVGDPLSPNTAGYDAKEVDLVLKGLTLMETKFKATVKSSNVYSSNFETPSIFLAGQIQSMDDIDPIVTYLLNFGMNPAATAWIDLKLTKGFVQKNLISFIKEGAWKTMFESLYSISDSDIKKELMTQIGVTS